jgi:hypothetical protein
LRGTRKCKQNAKTILISWGIYLNSAITTLAPNAL